ncbi:hypothetical protein [Bifidobacterium breve]|uniref:hypothetical protein n=1 Tax=Bifidobacterium breve TaxID=1685 RepID=UPI0013DE3C98|nr:hypothetical protein [Bifidobacterium breve]
MELKDWLSLITSWVGIAVSIWLGLRKDDDPKRRSKKKREGSGCTYQPEPLPLILWEPWNAMTKPKILGALCMLFAIIAAMFALADLKYGAAGFAVAVGIDGLLAGWRRGDDD